jgi:K+-transporting ATPase ATPase C chain
METSSRHNYRPVVTIAVFSLIVCGLLFPLVMTGLAQVLFPGPANGSLVTLNGCTVGSSLIAQNFNSSAFFFPRPAAQSASGVDPDITLQNATAQIPRISGATGLSNATLRSLVNSQVEGTLWVFGSPYVNVLNLNLALIREHPQQYDRYLPQNIASGNCTSS